MALGDTEALLNRLIENEGDDRFLPYWSDLWPSGVALARELLEHPERLNGLGVFELGAGLGLGSIAAVLAGARRVVAGDLHPEALRSLQANAARNGAARGLTTQEFDWRADFVPAGTGLLVGADILYDRVELPYLTDLLANRMGECRRFLIVEPCRDVAASFFNAPELSAWQMAERHVTVELNGRQVVVRLVEGERA